MLEFALNHGMNKASITHSYFISTWKTDNAGSSANDQITLPLEADGTYDFSVDWGDGSKSTITAHDQAEVTHTYSSAGTYTVKIKGTLIGFRFNNGGDKLKLLTISKWGDVQLGNNSDYFYGCSNLQITATDKIKNPTMTTLASIFRNCAMLNSVLNIDTTNIINFEIMFYGCTIFNQSVSNFNTISGEKLHYMFYNCTNFNQSVSNFNTANCLDMQYMFCNCTNFNQSVSNFNTIKVISMREMFRNCTAFNQDISNFSLKAVTNMTNMFVGATSWSTANYDLFLIGAHAQALSPDGVKSNVRFDCVTKYTAGGAAEAARNYLIGTKTWTINDAGAV